MSSLPTLFAEMNRMLADQPPGVQAHVEQEAAAIRKELAELGRPVNREQLEIYGAVVIQHGINTIPGSADPEWAASWHGIRMSAVAFLWAAADPNTDSTYAR